MPDYSKSKIYKLTSSNSNEIYIGSTTLKLINRKAHHLYNYKRYLLGKMNYITSIKIIEYGGDIDICLLEEYSCNNKEQLHQRERFYIENNECVNKYIPTRTMEEYRELNKEVSKEYRKLNKEKANEYNKEYRKLNKEKTSEYNKEYRKLNKEKLKEYNKEYHREYRLKKKLLKEQTNINSI